MEQKPNFGSLEEEVTFYKNLSVEYKRKWEETSLELEEFQESSRELEAELEAQLEQAESRGRELRTANHRLQADRDLLQESLEKLKAESYSQISQLQEELSNVKAVKDNFHKYIRELEQANDDLERAKRATVSSLEDFETRLNLAIERNAFLESELDEKEALAVTVQRLKDEARDLRQELLIQQSSGGNKPNNDLKAPPLMVDSNKLSQSPATSPFKSKTPPAPAPYTPPTHNTTSVTSSPLTPVNRISALNIVGDLLRKVGALESKLASCRALSKDSASRLDKEVILSPTTASSPLKLC